VFGRLQLVPQGQPRALRLSQPHSLARSHGALVHQGTRIHALNSHKRPCASQVFLELGADTETLLRNFDSVLNFTPLQVATQLDNVPMARLLLEYGANLVQDDKHEARDLSHPGYSAIHAARSAEMVQLLLDHHADPEQPAFNGYRPLHYYATQGNIEAMRAVLRNGVEVDPTSGRFSYTPLHNAVLHNSDAMKFLLEYGADAKKKSCGRKTTLHSAVEAGKIDVMRLLLEHWPEGTREKDADGRTPLHFAARTGKTDMVRLLLEFWPDGISDPSKDIISEKTPLHLAALSGMTEVVGLLVESWPRWRRLYTAIRRCISRLSMGIPRQ
jgi:ankyrin repeat protein